MSIVGELQYELGDRLCYVVRHFPLVDLHFQAMRAAEAAEAAAAQNQFWQMHYSLFEFPSALSETNLFHYARKLGLDSDLFDRDLNNEHHLRHIQEDIKTGIESGVDSTPTFFIADAVARAIAYAILQRRGSANEQPLDVDVNEIIIRPTHQT